MATRTLSPANPQMHRQCVNALPELMISARCEDVKFPHTPHTHFDKAWRDFVAKLKAQTTNPRFVTHDDFAALNMAILDGHESSLGSVALAAMSFLFDPRDLLLSIPVTQKILPMQVKSVVSKRVRTGPFADALRDGRIVRILCPPRSKLSPADMELIAATWTLPSFFGDDKPPVLAPRGYDLAPASPTTPIPSKRLIMSQNAYNSDDGGDVEDDAPSEYATPQEFMADAADAAPETEFDAEDDAAFTATAGDVTLPDLDIGMQMLLQQDSAAEKASSPRPTPTLQPRKKKSDEKAMAVTADVKKKRPVKAPPKSEATVSDDATLGNELFVESAAAGAAATVAAAAAKPARRAPGPRKPDPETLQRIAAITSHVTSTQVKLTPSLDRNATNHTKPHVSLVVPETGAQVVAATGEAKIGDFGVFYAVNPNIIRAGEQEVLPGLPMTFASFIGVAATRVRTGSSKAVTSVEIRDNDDCVVGFVQAASGFPSNPSKGQRATTDANLLLAQTPFSAFPVVKQNADAVARGKKSVSMGIDMITRSPRFAAEVTQGTDTSRLTLAVYAIGNCPFLIAVGFPVSTRVSLGLLPLLGMSVEEAVQWVNGNLGNIVEDEHGRLSVSMSDALQRVVSLMSFFHDVKTDTFDFGDVVPYILDGFVEHMEAVDPHLLGRLNSAADSIHLNVIAPEIDAASVATFQQLAKEQATIAAAVVEGKGKTDASELNLIGKIASTRVKIMSALVRYLQYQQISDLLEYDGLPEIVSYALIRDDESKIASEFWARVPNLEDGETGRLAVLKTALYPTNVVLTSSDPEFATDKFIASIFNRGELARLAGDVKAVGDISAWLKTAVASEIIGLVSSFTAVTTAADLRECAQTLIPANIQPVIQDAMRSAAVNASLTTLSQHRRNLALAFHGAVKKINTLCDTHQTSVIADAVASFDATSAELMVSEKIKDAPMKVTIGSPTHQPTVNVRNQLELIAARFPLLELKKSSSSKRKEAAKENGEAAAALSGDDDDEEAPAAAAAAAAAAAVPMPVVEKETNGEAKKDKKMSSKRVKKAGSD